MAKDWTGNRASTYATLGASNHSDYDRAENDYYATEPIAIDMLAQTGFLNGIKSVWECASGGNLVRRMEELGKDVYASDLYDHNFTPADIGEDLDWLKRVLPGKKHRMSDQIVYTYDWNANPDSLSKLYNRGEIKQERE